MQRTLRRLPVIAVRPPEYFPRLDYAVLLLACERFVLADTFPFSRQGHQNRARIRTSHAAGWQWLTVPRRHAGHAQPLTEVELDAAEPWARRHRKALHVNYSMAPFFEHYREGLDAILTQPRGSLADLAIATVQWTHEALGATSPLIRASDLPDAPATLPDVWTSLEAPEALATLPESAERDAEHLRDTGAAVRVLRFDEPRRRQNFPGFEGGLSTLDLILNYGPAAADMLREGIAGWREVVVAG